LRIILPIRNPQSTIRNANEVRRMASPIAYVPGPDSLAERLAEEMRRRWRRGERPLAEEFLRRHPELWDRPQAAAELIYEEICLREEDGEPGADEDVLHRFPQWAAPLRVLLECHRALDGGRAEPRFPAAGDSLGGFTLVAELGRGSQGRVFLATQPALAGRPVVLKFTPLASGEHLSLARLQHTHIVPLYAAEDLPARRLRALCLPYFGGATLAALLAVLRDVPPAARTGADLRRALVRAQAPFPLTVEAHGPARAALAGDDYAEAVCRMGLCLAEALAYAHERDLLHLDVKPSNVLLAADGQPMLLDFHLARGPVPAGAPAPAWMGGTPPYLAPEQRAAMECVRQGRPVPQAVDGRADVYALGVVLYEALAGVLPGPGDVRRLRKRNPRVSAGLADVVARCLAVRAEERYAGAAALADDLRRHLADEPLQGVLNRDASERWRKWRRRHPQAFRRLGLVLLVLGALAVAGLYILHQSAKADAALERGQQALRQGRLAQARADFRHGLALAEDLPLGGDLVRRLKAGLSQVERAELADNLHLVAEHLRGVFGDDQLAREEAQALERLCRGFWKKRALIRARLGPDISPERERQVRADLLDLAILWSDLHVRRSVNNATAARRQALRVLAEAEEEFGPSPVLYRERQLHAETLGLRDVAQAAAASVERAPAQTAWEHYALGCSYLRSGELARSAAELERAVDLEPQGLWPNFARGRCAYLLGRHQEALLSFTACVALAPDSAVCWYNRGLVREALGEVGPALRDYERALRLDPGLTPASQARDRVRGRV
jgi:serine/threonine protein kinase